MFSNNLLRSNYFRVRDVEAFKADLRRYGLTPGTFRTGCDIVVVEDADNSPAGAIALFSCDGWPMFDNDSVVARLEEASGEEDVALPEEIADLTVLVAAHLLDSDVAVFMNVGNDQLRCLWATAVAVNARGEVRTIDLEDIYGKARELATDGTPVTSAVY